MRALRNKKGSRVDDRVKDTALDKGAHLWSSVSALSAWALDDPFRADGMHSRGLEAASVEVALEACRWSAEAWGARSFRAESPQAVRLHNVKAYRFADGAQDALWRSLGRKLVAGIS